MAFDGEVGHGMVLWLGRFADMASVGATQERDQCEGAADLCCRHVLLRIPHVALLTIIIVRRLARRDEGEQPFENLVERAAQRDEGEGEGKAPSAAKAPNLRDVSTIGRVSKAPKAK
ncbi:hypothetical protein BF95_14680 [Sphingobium sp. Ant17]|nr:hypothetical protein BF95_14680 [Sphingobium sp. Ant17]